MKHGSFEPRSYGISAYFDLISYSEKNNRIESKRITYKLPSCLRMRVIIISNAAGFDPPPGTIMSA